MKLLDDWAENIEREEIKSAYKREHKVELREARKLKREQFKNLPENKKLNKKIKYLLIGNGLVIFSIIAIVSVKIFL